MDLVDLIQTRRFLGSEFLMWLWFKSECFEGRFDLENHGRVEVWFDDKLSLEAHLAETERNDFKGGSPAHSAEARTALQQGKRLAKTKLRVIKEGREWVFTIKAESLDLSGIKIPALLSREDEEQFYERMFLVEELEHILEALYAEFLELRLSSAWDQTLLPAMQTWIQSEELLGPEGYPTTEDLQHHNEDLPSDSASDTSLASLAGGSSESGPFDETLKSVEETEQRLAQSPEAGENAALANPVQLHDSPGNDEATL